MTHLLWNQEKLAAIVLASDAGKTECFAAEELAKYLTQMAGKPFFITDRVDNGKVSILVGKGACEAFGFAPDDDLTDDGNGEYLLFGKKTNLAWISSRQKHRIAHAEVVRAN